MLNQRDSLTNEILTRAEYAKNGFHLKKRLTVLSLVEMVVCNDTVKPFPFLVIPEKQFFNCVEAKEYLERKIHSLETEIQDCQHTFDILCLSEDAFNVGDLTDKKEKILNIKKTCLEDCLGCTEKYDVSCYNALQELLENNQEIDDIFIGGHQAVCNKMVKLQSILRSSSRLKDGFSKRLLELARFKQRLEYIKQQILENIKRASWKNDNTRLDFLEQKKQKLKRDLKHLKTVLKIRKRRAILLG